VRDWTAAVRERLGADRIPGEMDGVILELAGHLEDCYETLRREGLSEPEAAERVLGQFGDSGRLAREIRLATAPPQRLNDRTKQLWLPGLANLAAANLLLMVLTITSLEPRLVIERSRAWFPGLALLAAYLPWVAWQPVFGALGAWLSHRAGGGRAARLCAGLFPSIVMLLCWGLIIPVSALGEKNAWVMSHPVFLALGAILWVAPAMMGLLLGSLPFLSHPGSRMVPSESPCLPRS
jgi:hypothetical protein